LKALTIHQPWATLIAIGAKRFETRPWLTKYRGPIAIHASKCKDYLYLCNQKKFREALPKINGLVQLPLGVILGINNLVDCIEITPDNLPEEPEYGFGNYGFGRFMFDLQNMKLLPEPIPAIGQQKLWNWTVPQGVILP